MTSEFDRGRVGEYLNGEGSHFTAKLFRLISDSDGINRKKLRKGFPEEVSLLEDHLKRPRTLVEIFGGELDG